MILTGVATADAALRAIDRHANMSLAPFGAHDPRAQNEGRVMAHVLPVPAFERCHPMTLVILVKADDLAPYCARGIHAGILRQLPGLRQP